MYLQAIEINGFKSFAKKTRLVFEPGITAIVGPNGCGKSNVSDAIRWVLGEQRPTALRGGAMTDVIFNGTDDHKPMGMAEVSITFADCEKDLGVEFNIVAKSGSWYSYNGEKLAQGREAVKQLLADHPELCDEIEAKIREALAKTND